jgi:hypothetical protein
VVQAAVVETIAKAQELAVKEMLAVQGSQLVTQAQVAAAVEKQAQVRQVRTTRVVRVDQEHLPTHLGELQPQQVSIKVGLTTMQQVVVALPQQVTEDQVLVELVEILAVVAVMLR